MAADWFESVAEAQRRAERRLPSSVYEAIWAGAERGLTLRDNVEAFSELGFAPHVAGLSAQRDLTTCVMGQELALPVLISPTGVQAVHPEGEVAVARAAAARGTGQRPDVVPGLLGRDPGADARAPGPGPGRRRDRAHRHAGLDVLPLARLGQPGHP
jgi:FMN-dependent dehydrogenase